MVRLVLLILATMLFVLAAFDVKPPRVPELGWLGLACLTVSFWFPHP